MEKEPITVSGLQNLKTELEDLKNIQRPKIVEAIAEARSHGDLKENAEYHAAKEQQALIESRVIAINDIIARANVIDVTKIENNSPLISSVEVNSIILEAQKKKIRNVNDLNKIVEQVLNSSQKTILLVIYNSQNQRRYIGIKLD